MWSAAWDSISLLQRVDLLGERLDLGLELGQGRGLRLDGVVALEDLVLDLAQAASSWAIWFWSALYSSFFLTWLSLTLRSSILAC